MSDTRTIRVPDDHALDTHRDELERDGYRVVDETPASVTLTTRDHGSLAWHLFVFIATFWWTAGIGNLLYAFYRRYESLDRVEVRVVKVHGDPCESGYSFDGFTGGADGDMIPNCVPDDE